MNTNALFGLAGACAIASGALRIFAAFPLLDDPISLEWLYTAIDVMLLFGLIGIYLERHAKLGFLGLASFAVAVASLCFIGGPDADPFGFSTYEQGAMSLAIAMVGMSLAWVQAGERPLWAPACWFGSIIVGGVLNYLPAPAGEYGFMTAGVLFGTGFVAAGLPMLLARLPRAGTAR
jgi:hypothetical protein